MFGEYSFRRSSGFRQRHEMAPREELRVGWQWVGGFEDAGHDKGSDLKIICVGIGRRAGKMAEAAIGVAAGERPARGALNGLLAIAPFGTELVKREDGVEGGMAVARRHVEEPTAIGLLIAESAFDNFVGHRSG